MLVFKLDAKRELVIWLAAAFLVFLELLLSHTIYVTSGTYWHGAALLLIVALMFALKLRSACPRPRWLRVVSNIILTLSCAVLVLYALGVLTWYE